MFASLDILRSYVSGSFEHDIPVVDMDARAHVLVGPSGRRFEEINSNIWMEPHADAAYLATSRHGGGMVLRLLYVRIDDEWVNATTGKKATIDKTEFI